MLDIKELQKLTDKQMPCKTVSVLNLVLRSFQTKSAFTLVELIVVITILSILSTIGYISVTGLIGGARDSNRSQDLVSIAQSLDLILIKTGSYPDPDNSFTVTYSGGAVWYQGTIGDTFINIAGARGGAKFSKKPTDPLVPTKEYTYSRLAFGNKYQLKADWEGDSVAFLQERPLIIPSTYAASGNPTIAYLKGTYGGLSAKTFTGNTNYILAVPSIISSTGSAGQNIELTTDVLSGSLVTNGGSSKGITFSPQSVVVFSGATLPTNDDSGKITAMMMALQAAYSGTTIATNNSAVQNLLSTATGQLASIGAGVITNQLGGSATAPPVIATTPVTPPASPPTTPTGTGCTFGSFNVGECNLL